MTRAGANQARLRPDVDIFELDKAQGHDVRAFIRFVRLLRRLRPTVVHTRNWAGFDGIVAARLAGVPAIAHGEHGRDIGDPEGSNRRRNTLRRMLAPWVNRFTTVSEDLRRWLIEDVSVNPAKIQRIYNGVDTSHYAPGDRAEIRTALGVRVDAPVVGTVGRLDPVKDQAGLLEAFARLRTNDSVLLVVGDGPCRADLHSRAATLGIGDRVRFLGARKDVAHVLRAMDVFVLPSIAEGISNTILEAMATGLPVVATRVGGNPELVSPTVTGELVPRQRPGALADAIDGYLENPARRLAHGTQARTRALDAFGLNTMRDAYADLYDELGGAPSAGTRARRATGKALRCF
jgi:sugar transferase (PEP-CTERM/EpsH1 system associated)